MFNGQAIAQRSAAGVYFQLNDHLGGVIATFTASGGVSMVRRDAWGKELYRLGNLASSNYLFTGQRWDKLLGLYDYNARYYDAELGRFLSADTIIPEKDMLVSTLSQGVSEIQFIEKVNQEHKLKQFYGSPKILGHMKVVTFGSSYLDQI